MRGRGEGGIAEALGLAEHFADGEPICVVLGDNIIETNICSAVEGFKKQREGSRIILKEVPDAERFGVAEIWGNHVIGIEEKPTIRNPILLCTAVIHVNSDRFIDSAGSSSTSASEFLNQ